jgi:Kef-type K+ transport system membrane component KefB
VDFAAELGKLLLMFFCGLEINLALFQRAKRKSIEFGLLTTLIPLLYWVQRLVSGLATDPLGDRIGFAAGITYIVGLQSWRGLA